MAQETTQPNHAIQEAKRRARAELKEMRDSRRGPGFLEKHSDSGATSEPKKTAGSR